MNLGGRAQVCLFNGDAKSIPHGDGSQAGLSEG
jgi:hypothetical protein